MCHVTVRKPRQCGRNEVTPAAQVRSLLMQCREPLIQSRPSFACHHQRAAAFDVAAEKLVAPHDRVEHVDSEKRFADVEVCYYAGRSDSGQQTLYQLVGRREVFEDVHRPQKHGDFGLRRFSLRRFWLRVFSLV